MAVSVAVSVAVSIAIRVSDNTLVQYRGHPAAAVT